MALTELQCWESDPYCFFMRRENLAALLCILPFHKFYSQIFIRNSDTPTTEKVIVEQWLESEIEDLHMLLFANFYMKVPNQKWFVTASNSEKGSTHENPMALPLKLATTYTK